MTAWKWNFGAQNMRPSPKEPLYTVAELAIRLKTTESHLLGLMRRHPGLKPFREARSTASPFRNYYKLSDARRWWRSLQEQKP
ncbi:hypothetical protein ZHS_76 [Edwardsiella phage vB_EpM_ZHS]|nr:hypothetical protein ZHS_76 [Edwardsiella phage vB_EpM_ZHS]